MEIANDKQRQLIVHIPHAGDRIPDNISFYVDKEELMRQHYALKDDYVSDLAPRNYDYLLKCEFSRIVCDVERFLENEPMEKYRIFLKMFVTMP